MQVAALNLRSSSSWRAWSNALWRFDSRVDIHSRLEVRREVEKRREARLSRTAFIVGAYGGGCGG